MPESLIAIRVAAAQDAELLAEIGARMFRHTFARDNTPEDMAAYLAAAFGPALQAAELADPGTTFLIAEVGRETVGYARLVRAPAPECIPAGRPIEIRRIYAAEAWLGLGVGAALMRACLAEAEHQQCSVIWLDVWERNQRAIAFYQRWRFVLVGTQEFVLGSDVQHDLLMARPVVAPATAAG
ncbi:MAG: GNAT family N-acetyltransferase [Chloroflexi bacterium]|nr:GNAT family N-acetyltransferase [Chloroflexota bacterium]